MTLTHIALLTFAVSCFSAGCALVMKHAASLHPSDKRGLSDTEISELRVLGHEGER